MKYFIVILALTLFGGCTSMETPQYIGTIPTYANKPHPVNCGCCSTITLLQIKDGRIHSEESVSEERFHLWLKKPLTKLNN